MSVSSNISNTTAEAIVVRAALGGNDDNQHIGSYPVNLERRKRPQIGLLRQYKWQNQAKLARVEYPLLTVDALFGNKHNITQILGLAHLDLEGAELDVLGGAHQTIERDRPWLTLETFPRSNRSRHKLLVTHAQETIGYHLQIVDEVCGFPKDCRNMIAIPLEQYTATVQHLLQDPPCAMTLPLKHQGKPPPKRKFLRYEYIHQ